MYLYFTTSIQRIIWTFYRTNCSHKVPILKRSAIIRRFNAENNKPTALLNYGTRIHIDTKKSVNKFPDNLFDRVKIFNFDSSIEIDLLNATILFDRTGEYTLVKEKAKSIGVGEHSCLFH